MAKLHFKYGAMNAGKSTILLQNAHNYEERGQKILIIKPSIDTKGGSKIVSRLGVERDTDYLIDKEDSIIDKLEDKLMGIDCLFVDEAHLLMPKQVDELFYITKIYDVPVIAFGLRTDFQAKSFTGSGRLLELADAIEEMPTICHCGRKARFNARKVNGKFTLEGDSVVIDNNPLVEYESLCGKCYVEKVLKIKKKK